MTFCKALSAYALARRGIGSRMVASVDRHRWLSVRVIDERAACRRPRSTLIFGAFPR